MHPRMSPARQMLGWERRLGSWLLRVLQSVVSRAPALNSIPRGQSRRRSSFSVDVANPHACVMLEDGGIDTALAEV